MEINGLVRVDSSLEDLRLVAPTFLLEMDYSMGLKLLMKVLGQLCLELPIDRRTHTVMDALLGHLADVVHVGLLLPVALLSLLHHILMDSSHHLTIP